MENQAFNPIPPETVLLKRYKILNLIRKGGMGATYYGQDLFTGRLVAVKELLDLFNSPDERESGIRNFLSEINVLQSIRHPQIPKILDHFVEKRGFFFILEFIKGKDFTARLEEIGRQGLPENEVIQIGIHVCRILRYLHGRKPFPVIHRDIKPSNIMQKEDDGRIMLVDFGISRAAKPKEGMMIGTLGYSPPEQHLNQAEPRSDIYSLGATLHELSTGEKPDPENFLFAAPHELNAELSPEFSNVVLASLNYHIEQRFQNAEAFENALQNIIEQPVPWTMADPFDEACYRLGKECLFPLLLEIKSQFPNECQTSHFPASLDYFVFTLGLQIPFELIIQPDASQQSILFSVRDGILPPRLMAKISPQEPDSFEQAEIILNSFVEEYQTSRGF